MVYRFPVVQGTYDDQVLSRKVHQNADALSRARLPFVKGMSHVSIDSAFVNSTKPSAIMYCPGCGHQNDVSQGWKDHEKNCIRHTAAFDGVKESIVELKKPFAIKARRTLLLSLCVAKRNRWFAYPFPTDLSAFPSFRFDLLTKIVHAAYLL